MGIRPQDLPELRAQAEIDQLRTAIREALRLIEGGPKAAKCPSCGANPGNACYGNGPMRDPHGVRRAAALQAGLDELRRTLPATT